MKNGFMKLCSIFLVLILLVNMLPLQVFAQQLNTGKTEPIVTAPELCADETATDRVIAEIEEKRTEFSKEFLLSSGLHMVTVYPEAVHYAAATGWEEIDNTLIAKADGTITNTAGVWDVSFPQQLNKDKSITIEKDGYILSFFMSGELTSSNNAVVRAIGSTQAETLTTSNMRLSTATTAMPDLTEMRASVKYAEMIPEKVSSQITYANVYQNTNIIYDLESNKVKESVVLESYRSNLRGYRYTLDVGEMLPVLEEDGQILFYDAKGENIVMVMPAPYLIDDAGVRNDDVRVQLTGSGSRYTLTYLLPQQWLAAEDRAWPVILDPAVAPNMSTSNIRDRSVAEHWTPSQTWGYNACGYFNPEGIVRFFLQYQNLPHLTSSDVIVNATVEMQKVAGTASTSPIYVHKVNGTWESETITWANKPSYDSTIEDYAVVQENRSYIWDITDICRGWYAGENTGMMFKASDAVEAAQVGDYKQFYSSDYGTALTRPMLAITFRNNNGLESYWDYTSASAGRAGTGYVNNFTGNLVWVRNDIGFGGNRMPVSINHIYNANDAQHFVDVAGDFNNSNDTAGNEFGLGYGWRTNYNQLVKKWETSIPHSEHYIWEDADGTDHYFRWDETTGEYKDEDGLELTLTLMPQNAQNYKYKITDKNGNASYFDERGRLVTLENNQPSKSSIEIKYYDETNRITTITDGAQRTYVFEYDVATELLTKISYTGSGAEEISYVCFEYDGSKLQKIKDKDNGTSIYSYCNNNLLETAQDVDGYKLIYEYNTVTYGKPARIVSVQSNYNNQDGDRLSFEYDHNLTKITDHNGHIQIMQFNDMGNTVCIQDDEGRAQYAQFAKNDGGNDNTNKANQLTLSSKLQNTVSNLLYDSGFENETLWTQSANAQAVIAGNAHYGSKSMQVTTTATASGVYQGNYTVDPGQTVTFSAYVKTGNASAFVTVFDFGSFHSSEYLQPNSDWTRLEVSYTNATTAAKSICPHILTAGTGTFWADDVQLEYTSTASRYNLINNGDFQYGANGWSGNSQVADPPASSEPNAPKQPPQLSGKAAKIEGNPTSQKRISQTIAVSGDAGDSFVYAAWAKGDSASLWKRQYEDYTRTFAMEIQFHHTDGTVSDIFSTQFNPDTEQWQYIANAAVAQHPYSSITVTLCYDYNINTVYFDGIQLFREEFGTTYTYDDNGNVISTVDYANQKSQYYYSNDNLEKMISPTGAGFEYVYDDYNNVILSRSSEGLQYEFTYDLYGNPLHTALSANPYSAAITEGRTYYIRSRLSGKYMDLSGNSIVQKAFSGALTQQWQVVQNTDGSLSLINQSNPDIGYFTASNGESANGTALHTYTPYHTGSTEADCDFVLNAQGLRIQPATKYTYKILTKAGDYTTCVAVKDNSTAEAAALVVWKYGETEAQQWYFELAEHQHPTAIEDGGVYQFRAFHSGRYISVNGQSTTTGEKLVQYHQDGLASQKFILNRYGNTDYFTMTPQNAPDKLLQFSSGANSSGYRYLQLGNNTVADDKLFKFEYNAAMQGFLMIPKANETYALDVAYSNLTDGTDLIFTGKGTNPNRVFIAEKVSDALVSSATYSADGNRLVSTTDALGKVTTYGYNTDTNVLEWVQDPEDTAATRTTYTYDDMYRVESVVTPSDQWNDMYASYTYEDDRLTGLDTMSTYYTFTYGDFGLRTAVYAGEQLLAHYAYTDDGNNYLSRLDYENGDGVEYNYDDKGRLTLETFEDGDTVSYTYNSYGNLATVTDSIVISPTETIKTTTTYYYDLLDRMVKYREVSEDTDHSVTYEYDEHNNLSSLTEKINGADHTTRYEYDEDNRITSVGIGNYVEEFGDVEILIAEDYSYDGLGRIDEISTAYTGLEVLNKSYTFRNPTATTTSTQIATNSIQATIGELTEDELYYDPEPYVYDVTYSYTYDDNGNILSISDGTYTTSYVYDSANQLIRENNQELGFTKTWAYDNSGNILYRREYAYTTGSVENLEPVDEVEYLYEHDDLRDMLTAYDGETITHDEIGNPLNDGQWTYTWEHGRELAAMSDGYSTWEFTYDANGMRTRRTHQDIEYQYVYNGSQLTQLTVLETGGGELATNTLYFTYSADGTPLTVTSEGEIYFYVTNIQGDVIAILDHAGRVVCRYIYDAWGNVTTDSWLGDIVADHNPLRYRGYVYDQETELYYLQSRYYDPILSRFLNADAQISGVGGDVLGYNMFAYCFNNPVNHSDSSGNWPKWLSGALNIVSGTLQAAAGAAIGATVGWTGVGAVVAGFLVANGAATAAQGVGQIVNAVSQSSVMREDNIIRTGIQELGYAIGGDVGATVAGTAYDAAVLAATLYTPTVNTPTTATVNGACFVAGTIVLSATGYVPIENIQAGDMVFSEDPDSGNKSLKEVVQVFVRETNELIHIQINEETITTTPEHPFFVYTQGWVSAKNLQNGALVVLQSGETIPIVSIAYEIVDKPVTVYNFEVADFHTYYVGEYGVLVHNTCQKFTPDQQAVIELAKESKNGLSRGEAETLVSWAWEYGINAHGPMIHPNRNGIWGIIEHIKIFKQHIKIK